jgi:aspartate aminotransferase
MAKPSDSKAIDVHLNLNVRGMLPSATVAINEHCNRLLAQGREVFKLGLGQSPFPVPRVVVDELKQHAHQKDYLPVKGLPALREAVAEYHRSADGVEARPEDVLIGPGSKELMFLLQLVYYGDLVIPTPSWVSYAPQAEIIGRKVRWVQTLRDDKWRMTPQFLERLCSEDPGRPRIVILNYPNNPTGATHSADELERLAKVARGEQVLLLSDEIYGQLHFDGEHVSIARFYPEGTIISSGLSKWCGAGGWRLGHFLFPPQLAWLRDAMAAAASETYTSTSAPIQYAAVRAYEGGPQIDRYLHSARAVLRALGHSIYARLTAAGVETQLPMGAFYMWLDFGPHRAKLEARGITGSQQLCERLLEEAGVAILPGSVFGRTAGELTARLAFVDFDGEACLNSPQARAATPELDESYLAQYCPRVIRAIDAVAAWLES